MKILVDEMCHGLSQFLEAFGWDVIEPKTGTKDEDVRIMAKTERALILTKDKLMERKCEREKLPCLRLRASSVSEAIQAHRQLKNFLFMAEFMVKEHKKESSK